MSDSIHKTYKSVFGGTSKREVLCMCVEDDPDVMALLVKRRIKGEVKEVRKAEKPRRFLRAFGLDNAVPER